MVLDAKWSMRSPERDSPGTQARVAVIGSKGVGKTALTVRYLTKRFIGEYQSDTDMLYKTMTSLDSAKISLEILDHSSSLDEVLVRREAAQWADAWVVVYSVTCSASYEVALKAVEAVAARWHRDTPASPVLLLGNKRDLEHIRQVPESEGKTLAERFGCRFAEVSAAEMISQVNEALEGLLREVLRLKGQTSPRLRKLSVSKMFTQLMGRGGSSNSTGAGRGATACSSTSSQASHQGSSIGTDRLSGPRATFRERATKRTKIKQS